MEEEAHVEGMVPGAENEAAAGPAAAGSPERLSAEGHSKSTLSGMRSAVHFFEAYRASSPGRTASCPQWKDMTEVVATDKAL